MGLQSSFVYREHPVPFVHGHVDVDLHPYAFHLVPPQFPKARNSTACMLSLALLRGRLSLSLPASAIQGALK